MFKKTFFVLLVISIVTSHAVAADKVVVVPLMRSAEPSFTWQGNWQEGTSYDADHIVYFEGTSYISIVDHASTGDNAPPNGGYWQILASQGVQGLQGDQGLQGVQGLQGDQGAPGTDAMELQNLITVSASGADFTDPVAAIASINDASVNNPYLVYIGPGVYTVAEAIVMKPYVSIKGAGEQVTRLTGAISSNVSSLSALIYGTDNAALSDLSVVNTGGDSYSTAIGVYGHDSFHISNVTATASGATNSNRALYLSGSDVQINNVNVIGSAGGEGIYLYDSSPSISNVTIDISGAYFNNYGFYISGSSSPVMTNLTITVTDGTQFNSGIICFGTSVTVTNADIRATTGVGSNKGVDLSNCSATLTNVSAFASSSGGASRGILNRGTASSTMRRSTLEGGTSGIEVSAGTARVMQSSIIGGAISAGTLSCVHADNGVDTALNATCQ